MCIRDRYQRRVHGDSSRQQETAKKKNQLNRRTRRDRSRQYKQQRMLAKSSSNTVGHSQATAHVITRVPAPPVVRTIKFTSMDTDDYSEAASPAHRRSSMDTDSSRQQELSLIHI
eukprot:TRINITY_DN33282_c0_g1_i1.p2 TRINITY_DN33282_c0_g1~~TRINITY_DN33282_c0_g1_i1.p2  ORF type:complete len:134 (-),score=30.23 TRINITY_DN33282_c0_g1_i1:58-402(-)